MAQRLLTADEGSAAGVARARADVVAKLRALGREELVDDARIVVSEMVTNALLHAHGVVNVDVQATARGARIEVHDRVRSAPVMLQPSSESMTGRGLRVILALAARCGVRPTEEGKVVWVELEPEHGTDGAVATRADRAWDIEALGDGQREELVHVSLGEVPTDLLVAAKTHVDNLVREFSLVATGAESGTTAEVPMHLAELIDSVVNQFAAARLAIKRQALAAALAGQPRVRLELDLPVQAADAGEQYLAALDEADSYCRAARLLTLETPPQHRIFRSWYVQELIEQLRAHAAGAPGPQVETFEDRLLREIDAIAAAQRVTERAARLYDVSAALAAAATPEAVASAVVEHGAAALRAFGGGLLMSSDHGFVVPATVGYDEAIVSRLRGESPDMNLPAAVALRTGSPIWLESREERDLRFPELRDLERETVSMCAVPLIARGRRLGAIRFSFREARLFDEDERRFVLALAAQAAQALDRAQLYDQRIELSRRLQRSLLPGRLPQPPGIEFGAVYHPAADGMELGGDFYDVWALDARRWAFAIGDVAGTGPEAAAMTAMVRFTLRALAAVGTSPTAVLEHLNRAVLDSNVDSENGERFCTVLLGILTVGEDPAIELAGGGHPGPVVRRADGTVEGLTVGGSIVGVLWEPPMSSVTIPMAAGDAVVLFTDGASEARRPDGVMFEPDGVAAAVHSAAVDGAQSIADSIQEAVLRHTGNRITDDLAALVVRLTG